ncbi:MAG: YegS/Rv2252/BmrU family lipid kinase [Clostridiaceae bacterium]|jgi:YegS/Rv2252/BmrU family lipid kinase|nr:YegS/Rv2252/BmrU family lipid kinase [Clostridiaceae bacterium]
MRQKMLFIVNAKAGKAQIKNHILSIIDLFNAAQYDVTVAVTQRPQDATQIAFERGSDFDFLLCSGGDGTLNEVINGLMRIETKRPCIGYIPAGSTNDFAANLYTDNNVLCNVEKMLSGVELNCDIARFNDVFFVYCAAFGAFALTSYETAQINKNILGRLAYFLEGTRHLNTLKAYHFTISYDGMTIEDDFIYGMITNSDSVAGIKGFGGRNVQLDDGLYEVLLIRMPKNLIELQQIIGYLMKLDFSSDFFYRFKTSSITFDSTEPIAWNLDGEFGGEKKHVQIDVCKNAVTFLAPNPSELTTKSKN